ncbi:MAG: hypothetical protein ACE5EU_04435, partial [Paracoccaceae bacterium]
MPNLRGLILLVVLVAASAVLASRIRDDLQRPTDTLASAGPDGATPDQTIDIPETPKYDPPPIERFAAALDRPLFSQDRRPPADEPAGTGVVEDQALSATLQGILFAGTGSVALLTELAGAVTTLEELVEMAGKLLRRVRRADEAVTVVLHELEYRAG